MLQDSRGDKNCSLTLTLTLTRDLVTFGEKSDNRPISETVQDRDIIAMED